MLSKNLFQKNFSNKVNGTASGSQGEKVFFPDLKRSQPVSSLMRKAHAGQFATFISNGKRLLLYLTYFFHLGLDRKVSGVLVLRSRIRVCNRLLRSGWTLLLLYLLSDGVRSVVTWKPGFFLKYLRFQWTYRLTESTYHWKALFLRPFLDGRGISRN